MLHTGGIDGVAQAYIVGLGHVTRGVKVSTSNKKKRAERVQNKKKNSQTAQIGEKRSVDDSEIHGSRKRARKVRSQIRKSHSIINSTKQVNSAAIKHSNDTNNNPISALDAKLSYGAAMWSNSVPLRSCRNLRLPARFL